ncbi:phospholipase effector Tle1 domain-containing protein [Flavobacterium ardleyense]|uniref:Phospholipase effector Tle1 domain-containing protein n=1 Tax=Flavobacterium ardleyense TaxID=2038737 RepID=A0ABW5ZAD1_9FLAO
MSTTFVYNTGEYKTESKNLELVFGVFIDGTLNNKDNTDLRNKFARTSDSGIIDYELSDDEIAKIEKDSYKKVKNKGRIEKLLANRYRTPEEQKELDSFSQKDKYLVASHRTFMDRMGTDNSFGNDYTNVARMWKYCEPNYAVYVEGMGTDKESRDSQDGFAFGAGLTGIRARVRNGCEQVADLIKKEIKKDNEKSLKKITFDVFGFSRGAASARNFVHEVQLKQGYEKAKDFKIPDGYHTFDSSTNDDMPQRKSRKAKVDADELEVDESFLVDDKLPQMGHLGYSLLLNTDLTFEDLNDIQIVVRFIGIYDTVSSYYEKGGLGQYDVNGNLKDDGAFGKIANEAISTNFDSNVEPLKLNKLGAYQKLVHFTAKNEHRKNFSLTRVPGANIVNEQGKIKTVERNFPGVHCDIGGAYLTGEEKVDEIGTSLSDSGYKTKFWDYVIPGALLIKKRGLKALKQDLCDESWFNDLELEIKWQIGWVPPFTSFKKLTGTRKEVKKEYSYISLHFMEEYARETAMEAYFTDSIKSWFSVEGFLQNVKNHMSPYAKGEHNEEWDFTSDHELKKRKNEREKQESLENELNRKSEKDGANNFSGTLIEEETFETVALDEVVVYADQQMLRRLRNEYLHWSSNRDWFGMQPNTNRKRKEF